MKLENNNLSSVEELLDDISKRVYKKQKVDSVGSTINLNNSIKTGSINKSTNIDTRYYKK